MKQKILNAIFIILLIIFSTIIILTVVYIDSISQNTFMTFYLIEIIIGVAALGLIPFVFMPNNE